MSDNEAVMKFITDGKIMEKPTNCDDAIYKLMKRCWRSKPADRKSFGEIIVRLMKLLTDSAEDEKFCSSFMQNAFIFSKDGVNEVSGGNLEIEQPVEEEIKKNGDVDIEMETIKLVHETFDDIESI